MCHQRWVARLCAAACTIGLVSSLASCSDPGRGRAATLVDDGSVRGQLVENVARYDDDSADVTYELRVRGGSEVRQLTFETAPDLMPFTDIKVWGIQQGGKLAVQRWERAFDDDGEIGSTEQPLVGVPPLAPLKLALALVDVGAGNANPMITPAEFQKRVFDNPDSTKQYYLESSFGMQGMTGKVVTNVLTFPMTTCDSTGLARMLKPAVDMDVGQVSDVYLWYMQGKVSSCGWSGLSSGNNTYYNASSGCVVLAQEPAHSLGLAHSSAINCTAGPFAEDPNAGCMHSEYGNPYDVMGGGCRQFTAYHKTYRTYVQKCNVVRVRQSGTFNLFPTEKPCNGIQVLQVPMAHVRPFTNSGGGGGGARNTQLAYYTVELRSPIGFDVGMKPSVLINVAPSFNFNTAPSRGNNRGEHTWILKLGTGTARDGTSHALAPGQTFTDPAGGISITTVGVSADIATIKVDITGSVTVDGGTGATVCVDGTPISEPGPASCGDDGGIVPPPPPPPPMDASRDARATGTAGGRNDGGPASGAGGGAAGSTGGVGGSTAGTGGTGGADIVTTGGGTNEPTTTGSGLAGRSIGSAGTRSGVAPSDSVGGCSCRILAGGSPNHGDARGVVLLGLAISGVMRRRRRTSLVN